ILLLTNFQFGNWVRATWRKRAAAEVEGGEEEKVLQRKATELKKQAKRLQEEVERSGLGADLQPVPKPTVRDLSVPQAKSPRGKAAEPVREPEPADEGEVIPAREVAAASSTDILGKKRDTS